MGFLVVNNAEGHPDGAVDESAAGEAVAKAVRVPANALGVTYIAPDFDEVDPESFGFELVTR